MGITWAEHLKLNSTGSCYSETRRIKMSIGKKLWCRVLFVTTYTKKHASRQDSSEPQVFFVALFIEKKCAKVV